MFNLVGMNLGPYRIVEKIGEGGMATVYKAYQPSMDRYVAIKILPPLYSEDPEYLGRFRQEAKVIARLEHPNIVPVHDFGEQDGITYLVMRYIRAGSLKEILSKGPLPLGDAVKVFTQVASALDYAHRQGVIHRDVKPANILVDPDGNAFLTDFGIAKLLAGTAHFTATGGAVGTPAYMAPEQSIGGEIGARTDVYALGVVLYEMLTGRVPYSADTPMAVILKHINEPLPLPSTFNPNIPEAVERVILKAMAKEPEDRFDTAGEMSEALQKAAAGFIETRPATLLKMAAEIAQEKPSSEVTQEAIRAAEAIQKPVGTSPSQPQAQASTVVQSGGGVSIWIAVVAIIVALLALAGVAFMAGRLLAARGSAVRRDMTHMPMIGEGNVGPEGGPISGLIPAPEPMLEYIDRVLQHPPTFSGNFNSSEAWELGDNAVVGDGIVEITLSREVPQHGVSPVDAPLFPAMVVEAELAPADEDRLPADADIVLEQPDESSIIVGIDLDERSAYVLYCPPRVVECSPVFYADDHALVRPASEPNLIRAAVTWQGDLIVGFNRIWLGMWRPEGEVGIRVDEVWIAGGISEGADEERVSVGFDLFNIWELPMAGPMMEVTAGSAEDLAANPEFAPLIELIGETMATPPTCSFDFEARTECWLTIETVRHRTWCEDGTYFMSSEEGESVGAGLHCERMRDLVIRADVMILDATDDASYGLVFRATGGRLRTERYYMAGFTIAGGTQRVARLGYSAGAQMDILAETPVGIPLDGDWHELLLLAMEDRAVLLWDGRPVLVSPALDPGDFGQISLTVVNGATVAFDNIQVWDLGR